MSTISNAVPPGPPSEVGVSPRLQPTVDHDQPTTDPDAAHEPAGKASASSAASKYPDNPLGSSSHAPVPPSGASVADPSYHVDRSIVATAKRQISHTGAVAADAVGSGAWAYPIYGAAYIVSHPRLIVPILPLLLRALLISGGVVAACFFFLYLPQVAWLAIFTGPLAFAAAVPLVLAESGVVLLFLGKTFLLGPLGTDLFDAVLVQKGHEALVKKARPITTKSNNSKQLGKLLKAPFSKLNTDNLVRYILTLPFNFVPVVGTAFFLGYNGYKSGPSYHARYFQLKGFDKSRRQAFIDRRRGAYTAFGTMATVFNMVPVVNVVLGLASHVGAALWAAKIEDKDGAKAEVPDVVLPPRM